MRKKESIKKILYISSPITSGPNKLETLDYFAHLISGISQKVNICLKNYDFVVKVPEGGTDASVKQKEMIDEAEAVLKKNISEYEAIIISPFNKNEIKESIANLCKISKVFLIDQGYFTKEEIEYFKHEKVQRPPFVQSNWKHGGKIAALSLIEYFRRSRISTPKIQIIKGLIGSNERIEGFKSAFEEITDIHPFFPKDIDGSYQREDASIAFESILKETIKSKERIHAIFCTNDAMAIGVREVLTQYKDKLEGHYPKIVGYDAIRDFTLPLKYKDPFLYDTVDVQISKQIEYFVELLYQGIKSNNFTKEKYKEFPNQSFKASSNYN